MRLIHTYSASLTATPSVAMASPYQHIFSSLFPQPASCNWAVFAAHPPHQPRVSHGRSPQSAPVLNERNQYPVTIVKPNLTTSVVMYGSGDLKLVGSANTVSTPPRGVVIPVPKSARRIDAHETVVPTLAPIVSTQSTARLSSARSAGGSSVASRKSTKATYQHVRSRTNPDEIAGYLDRKRQRELLRIQREKELQDREMDECTFKPALNSKYPVSRRNSMQ